MFTNRDAILVGLMAKRRRVQSKPGFWVEIENEKPMIQAVKGPYVALHERQRAYAVH